MLRLKRAADSGFGSAAFSSREAGDFVDISFSGRKVAVVGLGKSNQALTRYLVARGARVTCFDRKTSAELGKAYDDLKSCGVDFSLGEGYLSRLDEFDVIYLTPGMRKDFPEIIRAKARGALLSTEIDLFMSRCRATVVGITGSAGKTTTSTLTYLMLKEAFRDRPIYLGGNIGSVLIEEVDSISPEAFVVLELSSFQLELTRKSPAVSGILNISPNHLDIHSSYQEYVEAKKNIFRFQTRGDLCVLNADDTETRSAAAQCPGKVGFFSLKGRPEGGICAWLEKDRLWVCVDGKAEVFAALDDIRVPGAHNVANILASALMSFFLGASPDALAKVVKSFRGVEHRIELVAEAKGVRYYNDSIATTPERTVAAIRAVPGDLVLILGGYDKGLPFDELAKELLGRARGVVTVGRTAPKIEDSISAAKKSAGLSEDSLPVVKRAGTFEEAVHMAKELSSPGSAVLLSPACASYDMFSNFEERGKKFKYLVHKLLEEK